MCCPRGRLSRARQLCVGKLHLDVHVTMQDANEQTIFEYTYRYALQGDGMNQEL